MDYLHQLTEAGKLLIQDLLNENAWDKRDLNCQMLTILVYLNLNKSNISSEYFTVFFTLLIGIKID